jgi:CDP-diacylglycerol--serine O-phosphatidyltransferase
VDSVPPKKPHFSLLRTFAFADLITLGNAAAGTASILLAMTYVASGDGAAMAWALGLLPLALVLDVLDGHVARWRHKSSALGADLDSLADIVSFGVAPAAVAFALGMRGLLDGAVLVYFVGCGISRLARFNVTAAELSGASGKVRYYEGTPIPTSVLLIGALAWAFARGLVGEQLPGGAVELAGATLHPAVLAFAVSGSLMASGTLRIPKP